LRISRSQSFRPRATLVVRLLRLSQRLSSWRAPAVAAEASRPRVGVLSSDVRISTMSPVLRTVLSGDAEPFTRAPDAWSPISVWILKAKSRAVAPGGRLTTLPLGVKT
jgi:hypothetical protein